MCPQCGSDNIERYHDCAPEYTSEAGVITGGCVNWKVCRACGRNFDRDDE